jgi:acetyl coenzyme A synthetase (ADP forming)-like protein
MMSLSAFFQPSAVAVIGASSDPRKLGYAVMDNLVHGGFLRDGRHVYPINPKPGKILGQPTFASVEDVPGPIDLGVVVVPWMSVLQVVESCARKHIPAVVVITAGFRESGLEGLEREQEILALARASNMRMIGPNCLGVIDTGTPLNASFSAGTPPAGPMAFMSQSGALGTAVLDWAQAGRLGLSKFVSLGNKADVSEVDLLQAWEDDAESRVILCYIEGVSDGQRFIEIARQVSRSKPVVAIKSGVTAAGARAVSSHTGSLAGSEQAYQAAFRQAGVVRAQSMEDLFDFAVGFGYLPPLGGERVAIVTNAGGPGILVADALESAGLSLARLTPETQAALKQGLPDAASAVNPVDVLGDARSDRYRFAMEQVLADPGVDAVLVISTPQAMTEIDATAAVVVELAEQASVPVIACFMGEARMGSAFELFKARHVPNFPYPERAAMVLKALNDHRRFSLRPLPTYSDPGIDLPAVRIILDQALSQGRLAIGDAEARSILQACGLPIPESELAETPEQAAAIATRLGFPVVLKIASPDILHKTDVGGVKIGLESASDVRDAFELITYRVNRYLPEARLWGCLVQKMAPPGLEVLVGMNRDPQFGPLLTFGLGGIFVETLKDVSFRLAPLSVEDAHQMLSEIRASPLLDGVRGRPAADKAALAEALQRISQLVVAFPEIAELDINPFIVYEAGQGGTAIDMRLVLTPPKSEGEGPLPRGLGG